MIAFRARRAKQSLSPWLERHGDLRQPSCSPTRTDVPRSAGAEAVTPMPEVAKATSITRSLIKARCRAQRFGRLANQGSLDLPDGDCTSSPTRPAFAPAFGTGPQADVAGLPRGLRFGSSPGGVAGSLPHGLLHPVVRGFIDRVHASWYVHVLDRGSCRRCCPSCLRQFGCHPFANSCGSFQRSTCCRRHG